MQPQNVQMHFQDLKQAPQLSSKKMKSNQKAGIVKID